MFRDWFLPAGGSFHGFVSKSNDGTGWGLAQGILVAGSYLNSYGGSGLKSEMAAQNGKQAD
jgi:hypothetical protein